ncbi:MAG: ribonuclease E activity regulator RraA, partial [Pseudomonadota bacterium]
MTDFIPTADLCDAHGDQVAVCEPLFRDFGGASKFAGRIQTVRTFEDNANVRAQLETPGEGRVLVVDGAGSRRCALFGGNLAALATQNGWAGVLIYGCVRDTVEISAEPVGCKALAAHPRKPNKGDGGEVDARERDG